MSSKIIIEKFYSDNGKHLEKVSITLDDKLIHIVDDSGCEFYSEYQGLADASIETARALAEALNFEFVELETPTQKIL